MLDNNKTLKRNKQECPQCGEIITDAYIEQNPFPEFPCPSCGALIDTFSLKNLEFAAENERAEERFSATLKVSYDSYNEFITEYTKDVSKGGIFINTKRHHEVNEIVDLSLVVPGIDKPLVIKGEVIHIKIQNVPDEDAGVGIKFIEIDPESRKALIAFMKTYNYSE
jgi:type IV pilus assembly protein PilZ